MKCLLRSTIQLSIPTILTVVICLLGSRNATAIDNSSATCAVTNVSTGSYLNVRDEPTTSSPKIGRIASAASSIRKLGATYSGKWGNWTRIEYESVTGWASSQFLSCVPSTTDDARIITEATKFLTTLANRDFEHLSQLIHPQKGLRFSPYAYIDKETDRVVNAEEITNLSITSAASLWGYFDGSGEPIEASFLGYFDKFVWSRDFIDAPYVSVDTVVRTGNTVDNTKVSYPDARLIEFHFPATSETEIDWASLRLLLEEFEGRWTIVGIVHDQWSI